jgi:hypothetical protein
MIKNAQSGGGIAWRPKEPASVAGAFRILTDVNCQKMRDSSPITTSSPIRNIMPTAPPRNFSTCEISFTGSGAVACRQRA